MRASPIFSDTRLSLRFFLTTPAKNPRTECCCQSVAFMIAAMVVPFGCRSIPSTVPCLDAAPVGLAETALGVAVGGMALRFPPKDLVVRDCLVARFAGFDLVLLVAIW